MLNDNLDHLVYYKAKKLESIELNKLKVPIGNITYLKSMNITKNGQIVLVVFKIIILTEN